MVISFAYCRISTKTQNINRQINEIKKFRPEILDKNIFTDVKSGGNVNRDGYENLKIAVERAKKALKHLGDGWFIEIIVTEIDRFGRDFEQLSSDLNNWFNNDIIIRVLNIPTSLVEVSNENIKDTLLVNKAIFETYSSLAQKEYELIKERQKSGLEYKKEFGDWDEMGRPSVMSEEDFEILYQDVLNGKIKPFEFMKKYNITCPTYYRYKKRYEEK